MSEEENIKDQENLNGESWEEEGSYQEESSENNDTEMETTVDATALEPEKTKTKTIKFSQITIGFIIKLVTAGILSILALKYILPSSTSDVFYKLYFILFIVFEIGVL